MDAAAMQELWMDLRLRLEDGQIVFDGIARATPYGTRFRVVNTETNVAEVCNSAGEAARSFIFTVAADIGSKYNID